MKYFSKFKVLFCVVFAFMFMFGNAFFVQAATLTAPETKLLHLNYTLTNNKTDLEFYGFIEYECSDPCTMKKKISNVNSVCIFLDNDGCDERFEQIGVDWKITSNRKQINGYVYGNITWPVKFKDQNNEIKVKKCNELVAIPYVYSLWSQTTELEK